MQRALPPLPLSSRHLTRYHEVVKRREGSEPCTYTECWVPWSLNLPQQQELRPSIRFPLIASAKMLRPGGKAIKTKLPSSTHKVVQARFPWSPGTRDELQDPRTGASGQASGAWEVLPLTLARPSLSFLCLCDDRVPWTATSSRARR